MSASPFKDASKSGAPFRGGLTALEAQIEKAVGVNIAQLQDVINKEGSDKAYGPDKSQNKPAAGLKLSVAPPPGSTPKSTQGQSFEPLDKSASQTVKVSPK